MGMRHVNHDYDLQFDNPRDQWLSEQILLLNMMILAVRNRFYLLDHPESPKCYDDIDCIYLVPEQLERTPTGRQIDSMRQFLSKELGLTADEIQHHVDLAKGVEIFRDIPRMQEHGGGDCDNWAARRAAELSVAGVDARPRMTCRNEGGRTIYHALVIWPDGSSEDPSLIKGMGGQAKAAARREECRKNLERYNNYWEEAKQLLATERFRSETARIARAEELKARIDNLGLLPKDGVFRVGTPKSAIVGSSGRITTNVGWMELRAAA